jgi:hypothetical protein
MSVINNRVRIELKVLTDRAAHCEHGRTNQMRHLTERSTDDYEVCTSFVTNIIYALHISCIKCLVDTAHSGHRKLIRCDI